MNPITYGTVKEEYICNGQVRTAYGIVAFSDADTDGSACISASLRDLSPDRAAVEALAERCNRCGLSVEALQELAEDLLVSLQ